MRKMSSQEIWQAFSDRLLFFIQSRVNGKQDADDILQDVFEKIHLKKSALKDQSKLESWVFQITRNSITDYFRKNKKVFPEELQDLKDESEPVFKDFSACLIPFIDQLPTNYKEAIKRSDLEGESQKEIAKDLGISYTGLKSRVQRGRKQLKEMFEECCGVVSDKYGNVIDSNCEC